MREKTIFSIDKRLYFEIISHLVFTLNKSLRKLIVSSRCQANNLIKI